MEETFDTSNPRLQSPGILPQSLRRISLKQVSQSPTPDSLNLSCSSMALGSAPDSVLMIYSSSSNSNWMYQPYPSQISFYSFNLVWRKKSLE